ncbi:Ser-Thr-rich glycosyl-phosphatidyl-inositol-anchored membrane family-domain-containing protein [Nemania serpens]|nr:Ser-Thr-rich glycosyl-phosphatidyl-inositol-anchored membrane family-domain-containing protein [Nemania serpens]
MKVAISSVVLAALLGFVNAKVHLTNSNFDGIEAGSTFKITWDDAEGPVTLTLKNGASDDLKDVETITANAAGKSFVWPVDPALTTGKYAIEIDDGTDVNYSKLFAVEGTAASSSSSTSSSSTTSVTSTSSSSSSSSSTSSSESSSTKTSSSAASSSSTASSSTVTSTSATRTSSCMPSSTPASTSAPPTTVPNANDAHSMAAPFVPGILAILGAALL